MRIIEFRVFLPFNQHQAHVAGRYANARRAKEHTNKGDGVEVLEMGEIEENGKVGLQAHRIYHIKTHVPSAIRWAIPDKYGHVHEHYKSVYNHTDTSFVIPEMGDDMILKNESWIIDYKQGDEIPDNLFNYTPEELKLRQICYLDMLNGPSGSFGNFDCHGLSFPEYGIYEMTADNKECNEKEIPQWVKNYKGPNIVCIVKSVKFHFKWWGVQSMLENYVLNTIFHDMFLGTHRAMVVWASEWAPMTEEQLIEYEKNIAEENNKAEFDLDDKESPQEVEKKEKARKKEEKKQLEKEKKEQKKLEKERKKEEKLAKKEEKAAKKKQKEK